MIKSLVIEVFVSVLFFSCGHSQHIAPRKFQMLTLDDTQITCSRNMACQIAVCLWERIPTITEERCTLLNNLCLCPEGDICAMSDHFTPRNKLVTFEYRCKNPADILLGRH